MIDPVPEDFHTITPQLVVNGVGGAIEWYTRALGAHELLRNMAPDGTSIMHAELLLGDSRFFVVDEFPGSMASPATLGGTAGDAASICAGRRRAVRPRRRRRRDSGHAGRRSVLGRRYGILRIPTDIVGRWQAASRTSHRGRFSNARRIGRRSSSNEDVSHRAVDLCGVRRIAGAGRCHSRFCPRRRLCTILRQPAPIDG